MADIKLGYGCGIKATLLMPTGVVCDLRDALFVNAVLALPNGSTMYAKDISADSVTNAIYVRLLADRELTTEGNYSIMFNVKLVDGVMYSTVAVNFANVTTNADAEYKEIVLSSNLEVTDNPHNVKRTGASPKVSPRQTWLVYNDEAKAYEDTGIPAEVNLVDYYTKEEADSKFAHIIANVDNKIDRTSAESYFKQVDDAIEEQKNEMAEFKEAVTDQVENYKPIVINGDVSNAADEEDITSENGLLKLANRSAINGMGYVILRKDKTFAEQVVNANTIYEIRYDFDLDGEEVTIPEGCVLDFQGGSFSNGIVEGNSTLIKGPIIKIFGLDINLVGSFSNDNVYPEWFGAIGDGVIDDLASINKTVQVAHNLKATIKFQNKNYAINGTILIGTGIRLQGDAVVGQYSQNTIISQKGDFNAIEINNIKAFSDPIAYYTNISIKDITIDMEGHRYSGIYYKRDSDDLNFKVFQFNRFSNLYIKNGYNGIYMEFIDSIDGFLYGEFTNLNLSDNIIGLHLDGSSFINLNTFYKCFFSRNKNIGIRISGGTLENNRFDTCSIEANGHEYDEDAYKLYGSSGATFIGSKGYNILDNCYMENNYPIRNNKYPSDMDDNFYTANIVCKGCTLISKNSLYAAYNRGINIGGVHCGLELRGNDYWNPLKDSKNDSFVKIWNGTFNVLYGYQKFLFLDEVRANVSKLNYAFEFEVDRAADVINYNIDDRSKFPKSNNIEVKGTKVISESINFYIDGISNGSGISEKNPAKTLEDIKENSYFRTINNKVIYILGECYSGAPTNTIISGKKVHIKGVPDKNSKIIFNTFLYNWNVDEIIFEDLSIDLITTYGLRLDKINSVIFNNCTINLLETDGHSFLRTNSTNPVFTNIVINNTSIKSTVLNPVHNHVCSGNPKMYKILIGEGTTIDDGIHLVDCDNVDFYNRDPFYLSYPSGYFAYDSKIGSFCYYNNNNWSILGSLPYNTESSGSFERKPSDVPIGFAYLCTNRQTAEGSTNGIMIYHKGNDVWVDALGRIVK